MGFKLRDDKLIVDAETGYPVAVFADSFVTALGINSQSNTVIFRLYQKAWMDNMASTQSHRIHQFAMNSHRARELGQSLLEYAAQAEKGTAGQEH